MSPGHPSEKGTSLAACDEAPARPVRMSGNDPLRKSDDVAYLCTMNKYVRTFAPLLAITFFASPGDACRGREWHPSDLESAHAVVVGRVSNYYVLQAGVRSRLLKMKVEEGRASNSEQAEYAEFLAKGRSFEAHYGKFRIVVERVLIGNAPKRLSAIYPELADVGVGPGGKSSLPTKLLDGRYLIVLRKPNSVYQDDGNLMIVDRDDCGDQPAFEAMPSGVERKLVKYLRAKKTVTKR